MSFESFYHGCRFSLAKMTLAAIAGAVVIQFGVAPESFARPEYADEKGGPQVVQDRFQAMDTDKDGKVSREEFFARYSQMKDAAFDSIDSDKDGSISPEEWVKFAAGHQGSDSKAGQGGMPAGMGGMGGMGMGGAPATGDASSNATGQAPGSVSGNATDAGGKKPMPSLIMPSGVGN